MDKEQGIIGQEIQMIEDDPTWRMYQNLQPGVVPNTPLRIPLRGAGSPSPISPPKPSTSATTPSTSPATWLCASSADVEPERVAQVARLLLPEERQEVAEKDWGEAEPETPAETECMEEMAVSSTNFMLGFKCPSHPDGEENLRLELLGDLAGDLLIGESSPLYAKLYHQGLIDKGFFVSYDNSPKAAFLAMGGESKDPWGGASGGAGGRGTG